MVSKGRFLAMLRGESGGIIIPNRSLWHQKTRISESVYKRLPNDRFGIKKVRVAQCATRTEVYPEIPETMMFYLTISFLTIFTWSPTTRT